MLIHLSAMTPLNRSQPCSAVLCTYTLFNQADGLWMGASESGGHMAHADRCRLSWLTNSALAYEPKCVGFTSKKMPNNIF